MLKGSSNNSQNQCIYEDSLNIYKEKKKKKTTSKRLTALWEKNFNILLFVTDRYG